MKRWKALDETYLPAKFPRYRPSRTKVISENATVSNSNCTAGAMVWEGSLLDGPSTRGALLLPRLGGPPRHRFPRPCPGVRHLSCAPVGIRASAAVWDGSLLPLPSTEARGIELACRKRATVCGTRPCSCRTLGTGCTLRLATVTALLFHPWPNMV